MLFGDQGLMEDESIHGILVELPLPQHLNEMEILQAIGPSKDVDGLAFANLGRLMIGGGYKSGAEPSSRPTVPMGVMELLLRSKVGIRNKCHASRNKCIASSNKCLTSSNNVRY